MKKLVLFIFVFLSATATAAAAKHAAHKKKISAPFRKMEVITHFGERVTFFKMDSAKDGTISLTMSSNGQLPTARVLSPKNARFILKSFRKLPVAKHIPNTCYRTRIDIRLVNNKGKVRTKSSCFGVKTVTSKEYQMFANLLVEAL